MLLSGPKAGREIEDQGDRSLLRAGSKTVGWRHRVSMVRGRTTEPPGWRRTCATRPRRSFPCRSTATTLTLSPTTFAGSGCWRSSAAATTSVSKGSAGGLPGGSECRAGGTASRYPRHWNRSSSSTSPGPQYPFEYRTSYPLPLAALKEPIARPDRTQARSRSTALGGWFRD